MLTPSPTAQAAAAWIALRKGLPAQGSSFVTLAVVLVEKQAEETSGFSVPFPEAAGQWCPHVFLPDTLLGQTACPQHPGPVAPWPLSHRVALSLAE